MLLVKLLQGLVSGVPFGTKEKCMAPANAFITSNRKLLIAALTKLRWERAVMCVLCEGPGSHTQLGCVMSRQTARCQQDNNRSLLDVTQKLEASVRKVRARGFAGWLGCVC